MHRKCSTEKQLQNSFSEGLPPVFKVPLTQEKLQEKLQEKSQEKWQERFDSLLSTRIEQGKREPKSPNSEKENNHDKEFNPFRQELLKSESLRELQK